MSNAWPNESQTWLLRTCLSSGDRAREAWNHWTHRLDIDQIDPASFNLLPMVTRNPALSHLKDPIFERCRGVYRQTWVNSHLIWKKLIPTLTQLLQIGVDRIVLLKGMAMILHYYRDFGVRVMGDVDILIPRSQLALAVSHLHSSGWETKSLPFDPKNKAQLTRWNASNFTHKQGLNLDLHWGVILETTPRLDESVLHHAIPQSNFHVASPTDLLLQTCVHGVKRSPVPLIRWIPDAMTLLNHPIDWDRLVQLAQEAHICKPLSLALKYLSNHFDAPIPPSTMGTLRREPSLWLENLEHTSHARGYVYLAGWFRYCLRHGHLSIRSQITHLHKYLQATALLKRTWHIPFYAPYWILKRLYRLMIRLAKGYS